MSKFTPLISLCMPKNLGSENKRSTLRVVWQNFKILNTLKLTTQL